MSRPGARNEPRDSPYSSHEARMLMRQPVLGGRSKKDALGSVAESWGPPLNGVRQYGMFVTEPDPPSRSTSPFKDEVDDTAEQPKPVPARSMTIPVSREKESYTPHLSDKERFVIAKMEALRLARRGQDWPPARERARHEEPVATRERGEDWSKADQGQEQSNTTHRSPSPVNTRDESARESVGSTYTPPPWQRNQVVRQRQSTPSTSILQASSEIAGYVPPKADSGAEAQFDDDDDESPASIQVDFKSQLEEIKESLRKAMAKQA